MPPHALAIASLLAPPHERAPARRAHTHPLPALAGGRTARRWLAVPARTSSSHAALSWPRETLPLPPASLRLPPPDRCEPHSKKLLLGRGFLYPEVTLQISSPFGPHHSWPTPTAGGRAVRTPPPDGLPPDVTPPSAYPHLRTRRCRTRRRWMAVRAAASTLQDALAAATAHRRLDAGHSAASTN